MSFLLEVEEAMRSLAPNANIHKIQDFALVLDNMVKANEFPSSKLLYIGNGSFKEAYYTDIDSIIVKFCSRANDTEGEMSLIHEAENKGLGFLFVPTWRIPLPNALPSYYLDDDDDDDKYTYDEEEHEWVEREGYVSGVELVDIEFQPICVTAYSGIGQREEPVDFSMLEYPSEEAEKCVSWVCNSTDTDISWLSDVYTYYGMDILVQFCQFCNEFDIWDLRYSNVGYLDKKPVILDWKSALNS